MYLLYVNEIGTDYKGQKQFEFIFGKDIDIFMNSWLIRPSSGRSTPPDVDYIDIVGLLKNSDLNMELIQNSDYFSVVDAISGVVALAWEPFDDNDEDFIDKRLSFHYGDTLDSVVDKLSSRGLRLINEDAKYI